MRCPFAIWRPLPENHTAEQIDPRIVITHTAVSTARSLFGHFNSPGVDLETHFYVLGDGSIEQYLDTERQADGNRYANWFAISVENQDNAANPIVPMTLSQLNANIRLNRWLSDVHPKIKRQRCDRWDGSGYGYHTMWGAPSQWTPVKGKTCPGPARIRQFEEVMIPALVMPAPSLEDVMDLAETPSWMKRQPNMRFPAFIGHFEPDRNALVVLSRDNAPFTNPNWVEGRKDSGSEDGVFLGMWFRRFFNTGPFYGYGEADGSFFAICQNGTYDLSKKPA